MVEPIYDQSDSEQSALNDARDRLRKDIQNIPDNPHGWLIKCACCDCAPNDKSCRFNCVCHDVAKFDDKTDGNPPIISERESGHASPTPSLINGTQFSEALNHLQLAEEAFLVIGNRSAAKSVAELHEKMSGKALNRLAEAALIATSKLDRCEREQAKVTRAITDWANACPCMCDACTKLRNELIVDAF